MKQIITVFALLIAFTSCKNNEKTTEQQPEETKEIAYASFGEKITDTDALPATRMAEHYKAMTAGDTINSKMTAKVDAVCQVKGCWMTVNLEDGTTARVKFKDYGFFMPKNIAGKEVIVNGLAYVDEVSVAEQRHFAEDAGKSKEEIEAITEVKRTYTFMADGVLLKEN